MMAIIVNSIRQASGTKPQTTPTHTNIPMLVLSSKRKVIPEIFFVGSKQKEALFTGPQEPDRLICPASTSEVLPTGKATIGGVTPCA